MNRIDGVTSDFRQVFEIAVDENSSLRIEIYYVPSQFGWFADFDFDDFSLYGARVVMSTNLLAQYDQILPFGLAVLDPNGNDPTQQNSFVETHTLYLLDETDLLTAREI